MPLPKTYPKRLSTLRVHSLARSLGTTSKRVLDALAELDGRTRSAHSTVDQSEAARVREALANETGDDEETADVNVDGSEPESRLILETASQTGTEPADYLPLFVAPQPVVLDSEDDEDDDTDEGSPDSDEEQADRPAARRRRRGRRGRGRGRGEQNGDDSADDGDSGDSQAGDQVDSGD